MAPNVREMERTQRSQGQLIAGAAGVLLFIFLFLPWFGEGGTNLSGWEGQSSTDVYLLITALVAVATVVIAGRGVLFSGLTMNGATAVLGAAATLVLLWLSVFDFPAGADRKVGVYLSLVAVAVIAVGGYTAARDADAGGSRERYQ